MKLTLEKMFASRLLQRIRDTNPILTDLACSIADKRIQGCSTMRRILEIEPPETEMYHLRQSDSVLDSSTSFYLREGQHIQSALKGARSPRWIAPFPDLSTTSGWRVSTYVPVVFPIQLISEV